MKELKDLSIFNLENSNMDVLRFITLISSIVFFLFCLGNDIFFDKSLQMVPFAVPILILAFVASYIYRPLTKIVFTVVFTGIIAYLGVSRSNVGFASYIIIYNLTIAMVLYQRPRDRYLILLYDLALIVGIIIYNDVVLQQVPLEIPMIKVVFYFILANACALYAVYMFFENHRKNNIALLNLKRELEISKNSLDKVALYKKEMETALFTEVDSYFANHIEDPIKALMPKYSTNSNNTAATQRILELDRKIKNFKTEVGGKLSEPA